MAEQKPKSSIPEESLQQGYEVRDADIRVIFWSGLTLAGVMILVTVVIGLLYWFLNVNYMQQIQASPQPFQQQAQDLPPAPRLQRNPATDMQKMRSDTTAILGSYDWVDKQAGVVRIPITDAMKLTLDRGLPTRPDAK